MVADLKKFLEDKGIDPEDFLERASSAEAIAWRVSLGNMAMPPRADEVIAGRVAYVALALAPEDTDELVQGWKEYSREADHVARWPELERILGWLDPLEAELLEVGE